MREVTATGCSPRASNKPLKTENTSYRVQAVRSALEVADPLIRMCLCSSKKALILAELFWISSHGGLVRARPAKEVLLG